MYTLFPEVLDPCSVNPQQFLRSKIQYSHFQCIGIKFSGGSDNYGGIKDSQFTNPGSFTYAHAQGTSSHLPDQVEKGLWVWKDAPSPVLHAERRSHRGRTVTCSGLHASLPLRSETVTKPSHLLGYCNKHSISSTRKENPQAEFALGRWNTSKEDGDSKSARS